MAETITTQSEDEMVRGYLEQYRALGLAGSPWERHQVKELERHLGLPFPASFHAYLLLAGQSPPRKLIGSDCNGRALFELRGWAEELLEECGRPFVLPADSVVFYMHQGYQFSYFRTDGINQDPPVEYFLQDWTATKRNHERFSDWVRAIA